MMIEEKKMSSNISWLRTFTKAELGTKRRKWLVSFLFCESDSYLMSWLFKIAFSLFCFLLNILLNLFIKQLFRINPNPECTEVYNKTLLSRRRKSIYWLVVVFLFFVIYNKTPYLKNLFLLKLVHYKMNEGLKKMNGVWMIIITRN